MSASSHGGRPERPGDENHPQPAPRPFLAFGATTGVGSVPHRDPRRAAEFALDEVSLPFVPTLPRRCPAEGMIAQAVFGLPGVTLGQYGSIAVDISRFDPAARMCVNLTNEAFGGLRTFLGAAVERRYEGPVKWQFVGPVTLGVGLVRAGAPVDVAFRLAVTAVRAHLVAISEEIARQLPSSAQVAVIDEPWLGSLLEDDFPVAPDTAIDLVSEAMAVAERFATVGVHCCADADIPSLLATGPHLLSIPATRSVEGVAGYIQSFLEGGGTIAWGAVPTGGPILTSTERCWRDLCDLWCALVARGCDPVLLRSRSIITPECGLGLHSVDIAERVFSVANGLHERIADQMRITQFTVGG